MIVLSTVNSTLRKLSERTTHGLTGPRVEKRRDDYDT